MSLLSAFLYTDVIASKDKVRHTMTKLSLLLLSSFLMSAHLFAAPPSEPVVKTPTKTTTVGKRQAMQIVKNEYPGQVLKVKEKESHFKVRVLQPKGHVVDLKVNKADGKVKKDNN